MFSLFVFCLAAARVVDAAVGNGYASRFVAFHAQRFSGKLEPEMVQGIREKMQTLCEALRPSHDLATAEPLIQRIGASDDSPDWSAAGAKGPDEFRGAAFGELLLAISREVWEDGWRPACLSHFVDYCSELAGLSTSDLLETPRWPDLPQPYFITLRIWTEEVLAKIAPEIPARHREQVLDSLRERAVNASTKQDLEEDLREILPELLAKWN